MTGFEIELYTPMQPDKIVKKLVEIEDQFCDTCDEVWVSATRKALATAEDMHMTLGKIEFIYA